MTTSGTQRETETPDQGPQLSAAQIWRQLGKSSFAVLSYTTPAGQPRSSGVLYACERGRLYMVVAADGWKARHITTGAPVAVTVPVRRGAILALLAPIPPATISFHGTATVRHAEKAGTGSPPAALARLLPPERREQSVIIEIEPRGRFVAYGIGVSLTRMRHPVAARATVPVRG